MKTFRRCLVSRWCLEKPILDSEKLDLGLLALNHLGRFADKRVIICVLCFNQFVVYSMRKPVVYWTAKK